MSKPARLPSRGGQVQPPNDRFASPLMPVLGCASGLVLLMTFRPVERVCGSSKLSEPGRSQLGTYCGRTDNQWAGVDRRTEVNALQENQQKVSTLELFFDLVFVFTLTQLASLLRHDPTLEGAARTVLAFTVLYWMYGGYVWLTNRVAPN